MISDHRENTLPNNLQQQYGNRNNYHFDDVTSTWKLPFLGLAGSTASSLFFPDLLLSRCGCSTTKSYKSASSLIVVVVDVFFDVDAASTTSFAIARRFTFFDFVFN